MIERRTVIMPDTEQALDWDERVPIPSLIQMTGSQIGLRYVLGETPLLLGRSPDCAIHLEEPSVSRFHARIWCTADGEVLLEDLGSSNGSFVNNARLTRATALIDKDILRFGKVLFKFYAHDNLDSYLHDRIYRLAILDQATGIYNKGYLLESLRTHFENSKRFGYPLSLIYFDLDHFKSVNDSLGHSAGDQVLELGSFLVKQNLRKRDVFGRYGGEEFVVVLPQTRLDGAVTVAERLRMAYADYPFFLSARDEHGRRVIQHRQTISLGVSELADEASPDELLASADRKLYESKRGGRDMVTA